MNRTNVNRINRIATIVTALALLVGLLVPFVSPASVNAQGAAPILVIVDAASSNKFGSFIEEMLNAEGINDFEVRPLTALNSTLLAGREAVILAESSPTSAQITALDNYVNAGGGLIAMRPATGLSATLGVSLQSGTTTDGYMRITDTAIGGGLYTDTMQFHGVAKQFQLAGAREVARLYSTRTGATLFPAVTINDRGAGKAAMFAYDLPQSVVLTRQGNPANANVDADGDGRFRTIDLYRNWADLERSRVPQADMQQRLLVRLLEEVGAFPIPRLWYFPNSAPTVIVATGDNHGPNPYYGPLIDSMLAQGVPMTIFGGGATTEETLAWMAQGVDFATHPYVDCGYECGYAEAYSSFENLFGFAPRTVRTHQIRGFGWTDAASIESQFGVELDFNYYQWGSWVTNSEGPALGYIGGSGQPMRFIDANGNLLPIYQQHTNLVDEFLSPGVGVANLNAEQAEAASRTTIDDLVDLYYEPLVTQYHGDYYHNETRAWDDESTRYALQRGAFALNADDWLTFIQQRAATAVTNTSWQNNTLTFDMSAGGSNQSTLIPLQIGARLLDTIRIGGSAITYTTRIVHGRAYASIPVSTAHYVITYTSDTTAPTVTGTTPLSGATSIPLTSPISVTFSEVRQRSVTEAAFSIAPAATGVVAWNSAGTTMTFTPTALLSPTTTYTATVTTGARDLAGNPLASTTSWSFTTATATPPPTITGVSPISGTIEGGTVVTITGANFTGATAVKFGTVAAASITVNSDTQITATTAAHPAGAVHITITTAAGTSALTANDQFTFIDGSSTVSILGIDPATGSANGGTVVTITGTGFQTGMSVTVGGVAATQVTVSSTTRLKATTPAHAPGVANVVVTAPSNASATLLNGFTLVACPARCVTYSSTQYFGAGSFDAGVIASETTDGEVMLAPATGAEFSGNAIPATWSSTAWQTGGQSNVSNGELRADGTMVATNDFFGPGRSIEFVATFQSGALQQHIGFATNLRDAPWAIFSTRADGAVLYARTNAGNGPLDTQLSSSWLGAPHRFRIDWTTSSIVFSIDGVQVATHNVAITANMRPVISDGTAGGAILPVDWLRVDPYAASGTFDSRIVDAGGSAAWGGMFWSANVPSGTSVSVSVRTGNTPLPDGTWTAFSTLSSSGSSVSATSRYLQYRVSLATTSSAQSPAFRDVTIAYSVSGPLSPTIDDLNPSSGSTHGGTVVTITGSNYAAGATVTFGGVAATSVTVVNSTTITATTPASAAGPVDVVVTNSNGGSGTLPASFTFVIPPPVVSAIDPTSGTRFGGTQITITGTNFDGATEVTFGTATATFTLESPTTITAIAPSHAAAVVDVRVRTGGGLSATSIAGQYTYLDIPPPPTLAAIDAGTGPTAGGATVTLTGTNFVSGSTVTFDGIPATSINVVSNTRITLVTPAHAVGSVTVVVDTPDDQSASLSNGYRYVDCSEGCVGQTSADDFRSGASLNTFTDEEADGSVILAPAAGGTFSGSALPAGWSASPWSSGGSGSVSSGSVHVDSALVATGSYYGAGGVLEFVATFKSTPSQYIGFGQTLLSAPWAIFSTGRSGTSLYVTSSSPLASQETNLGSNWLGSPHQFRIEWQANRVIYAIDGTVVATHNVAIGGQMRPVISDWTLDTLTVDVDWMRLSPYQASGSFTSRVLDAGGAATWTSANWSASTPAGTTLAVSVRSGTTPVPDGSWSSFSTLGSNGAAIANTGRYLQYRLDLTGDGAGITPRLRDILFTYTLSGALGPAVSAVTPASGPTGGGTSVTITGSAFATGATVSIGGVAATAVTVVNATTITATTPAHAAGTADVTVTNPDGQRGILTNGYTFIPPVPAITGLTPSRGALAGGTVVTISGTAFTGATVVTFGGAAATFTVDSDTKITATSPSHAAGIVDVVVTTAGGTSSTAPAARFEYFAQSVVSVTSIDPDLGSAAGGTNITISGSGFQTNATVSLGGTTATNVVVVNATMITATTAAHSAGLVNVAVTNPDGGQGTYSNGYRYVACTDGC
ncbi:MAG TPA: IPT/TIG domain-containing protein, partial [Thermomicrobiales bacterium]|nr:IPT/TIG domain-containing protein [Thermomicrobiales bacterium]